MNSESSFIVASFVADSSLSFSRLVAIS
jgi:hypothetical protein